MVKKRKVKNAHAAEADTKMKADVDAEGEDSDEGEGEGEGWKKKMSKGSHSSEVRKTKKKAAEPDDEARDEEPKKTMPKSFQSLSRQNLFFLFLAIRDDDHPIHFRVYEDCRTTRKFSLPQVTNNH